MSPAERNNVPLTACCQVVLFGWTVLLIVVERTAIIYCIGYYLWHVHRKRAALTFVAALPGTAVQVLSFKWYCEDGYQRKGLLAFIHVLHLGIFKRLWDCMRTLWHLEEPEGGFSALVMQQADVSVLRLIEVLLLTLPETVLQTYYLFTTDVGILSPVSVCCAVCLLSVSWSLVLYSRACTLVRPGHLAMPPAALLCQLLWRTCMLGARLASLMFFTRVFCGWIFAVVGFHWLTTSLWIVTQQTDIFGSPWRWHLFNCILGAVHIFFFLNATWDIIAIAVSVFCSIFLGITSLVLYYRFLHPKSTEISQNKQEEPIGVACFKGGSTLSLGEKIKPAPSVPTYGDTFTGIDGTVVEHSGSGGTKFSIQYRHHHWLLIRLALKTGNIAKVNQAYGFGGVAAMLGIVEVLEGTHAEAPEPDNDNMDGIMPISDGKEDFQSADSPSSLEELDEKEEKEKMDSPLESLMSDLKRGSPEGKSVFEESPELRFCPTESSTTLYFSADPQSPGSASYLGLDRDSATENVGEFSPMSGDRVEPRFASSAKMDPGSAGPASPRFLVPRRQVVLSWKDKPEMF
ncbi:XK-related protein 5-like [Scleropages formosus]|uniref:XK-related protein n=1 Tax=Scleropages formosus TaxID=113540 RepID=A0A0P7TY92_SCLFO|nr:XK-related protein 5-like [Scleropages formosus]